MICGRNNSGKTTLLEAISTAGLHEVGLSPSRDSAERIALGGLLRSPGSPSVPNRIREQYVQAVEEVLSGSDWFSNDNVEFMEQVAAKASRLPQTGAFHFDASEATKKFVELVGERQTALIPASRRLELGIGVDPQGGGRPSGEGVINSLFYAKNRPDTSEEREILGRVAEAFRLISGDVDFDVVMDGSKKLDVNFRRQGRAWLPAGDCGLGLQQLLLLLYFAVRYRGNLLLVEEPESHMHAEMQRRFLQFLSDQTESQYILTTHSNVFLNFSTVDKVYLTRCNGHVTVEDVTNRALALHDLGFSVADNLVSDLIVLVEGPHDKQALESLFRKMGLLKRFNVLVWPLGGDIMHYLDLQVLAQGYRTIALIDRDPKSRKIRHEFAEHCKTQGVELHWLKRYSLENYYTVEAIRQVYPHHLRDDVMSIKPDTKVEKQLGFDVKKGTRAIVEAMSIEDLEDTDLMEFLCRVEELCGQS